MENFKIYEKDDKTYIERLVSPRFVGEITFGAKSDIENIEWIDSCVEVMTIARAMREAGEFIATNERWKYKDIALTSRIEIGKKLKAIRLEKGMTYTDIQRASLLGSNQIAAIESGKTNYSVDSLIQYLAAVGAELPF
jgi:Helix-turn-helix.